MVGDWGIHMLGPANWALQLGSPTSVECTAVEGKPRHLSLLLLQDGVPGTPNPFVPAGKMRPVTVYWYEATWPRTSSRRGPDGKGSRGCNELFVGSRGFLGTGGRGESVRMVPEAKMRDFKKPDRVIKRSPAISGLGSGLQRRRGGLLELQHCRTLYRMGFARGYLLAIPE